MAELFFEDDRMGVQDPNYNNQLQNTSFQQPNINSYQYGMGQRFNTPNNWRGNLQHTYGMPGITGPNMRDVSGEVGEYGQIPGQGNNAMMYQAQKKGFNFPNFGITGIIGAIGDKFKRSPEKQAAYEAIMGSIDDKGYGTYKGNQYRFGEDPSSGLTKVYSEVNPFGKNFDSMFGSKSLEEMDQKTLDWAIDRLNNNKKISTRLTNILRNRNMLPTQKTAIDLTTIQDPGKGSVTDTSGGAVTTGGGGVFNPRMDPKGRTDTAPSWHGATAAREAKGEQVAGPGFGSGAFWAKGGRVGYRNAGPVLDVQEDESTLDFMQDQGIPYSEMAEADHPFDLRIQELMGKGLSYEDAYKIAEMEFQDLFAAQEGESDQGIASLV